MSGKSLKSMIFNEVQQEANIILNPRLYSKSLSLLHGIKRTSPKMV